MSENIPGVRPASRLASRKVTSILIVALLISIGVISYIVGTSSSVKSQSLPVVESGDMVYVDYVGTFATNPGGWVFDTSKRTVGLDDSIVKSLYFIKRQDTEYKPLNFTAGTATNYLRPFVKGVLGMTVTQTKTILIDAKDAYPLNPNYFGTSPLIQEAQVIENMSTSDFQNTYSTTPQIGMTLKHYFWEWNLTVINIQGDKVVLQNQPYVGQIVSSYGNPETDLRDGWYQRVIEVNASAYGGIGTIKVQNLITLQDIYQKKGTNFDQKKFTLIDVNETAGVFAVVFNDQNYIGELTGRPLIFEVTVTKILKA